MREIKFRVWNGWLNKFENDFETRRQGNKLTFWVDDNENDECVQLGDIQQFTGLKDKNGKEIYEGDIIEQIFYGDEISKIMLVVEDIRNLESIRCGSSKENKIIGNIYENPEFVETKGSEGK